MSTAQICPMLQDGNGRTKYGSLFSAHDLAETGNRQHKRLAHADFGAA
jgi:hypothetical protein